MDESVIFSGLHAKPMKSEPIAWSGPAVSIVSLGVGAASALPAAANEAIEHAELIFGAEHHLHEINHISTAANKQLFPTPFSDLRDLLAQAQGQRIVVLASGDALFYGVGSWLNRLIGRQHLQCYANISSIQACFHAIGLPWQQAEVVSLHGRPMVNLRRYMANNALLALFTDGKNTPSAIATELVENGFASSCMWLCEEMGGDDQKIEQTDAASVAASTRKIHPLNICIVLLQGDKNNLSAFPGIPDHLFSTGSQPGFGMISKREVRLAILSMMQPQYGEVAWDVGAGCGSVSVEWARWNTYGHIYAIESDAQRCEHIRINSDRFGVSSNLSVIHDNAPTACQALPAPDCVFIGGSDGQLEGLLDFCWSQLSAGGKLVASGVTADSQDILASFCADDANAELSKITVSKRLPDSFDQRDLSPVLVIKRVKVETV